MSLIYDLPPRIAATLFRGVIANGPSGALYLTFDDGPDPIYTESFLRVLTALNCRAAFFLSGEKVVEHPQIVRQIAESGHIIGSHGFSHKSMLFLNHDSAKRELLPSLEAIESAIGIRPVFFRPPYGKFNPGVLSAALELDLTTVLWSLSGSDWKERDPAVLTRRIVDNAKDGDIILLHDSGKFADVTLAAVPDIVTAIREKGMRFAPLTGSPS